MSICQMCHGHHERPTSHANLTREYYRVLIAALRYVAYRNGYALTVHGSLGMDIDLVAVPWRESATSPEFVAEAIRKCAEAIIGTVSVRPQDPNPTLKPCGRLAWSFYLGLYELDVPYIDLSVFPVPQADPTKDGGQ